MLQKMTAWLATMPSTNLRIAFTLLLSGGTACVYWGLALSGKHWEPSWEWLAFLTAMAGIDVAQFATKRKTQAFPTLPESPRPSGAFVPPRDPA